MTKLTKTRYKKSDSKFSSNTTKRTPSMVQIPVKMFPEGKHIRRFITQGI